MADTPAGDPRRKIPGVDTLLSGAGAEGLLGRWPRVRVAAALRLAVAEMRREIAGPTMAFSSGVIADPADPAPYLARAEAALVAADRASLRPVINATGVVLHTNLGRAPLAPEAVLAAASALAGYANLEFDLDTGLRGSRYVHCSDLLRELVPAPDALVVNNCAAALVLALSTLARGRGVLVSRGELVEIGGGFRIPAMITRAGARLVEVGSTNRTRVADYREALEAAASGAPGARPVGAILKVHRSNFRMSGFTEEAALDELVALGASFDVPVVHDVGSGLLVDPSTLGLPPEPRAGESVAAGAALAVFSGDKLLGGPQAGIVVGTIGAVEAARRNPLCRTFRVDKGTLAALEATLRLYRDPASVRARVPVLSMLTRAPEELESRARALADALGALGLEAGAGPGEGRVGGGTYPEHPLPSWTVRVRPPAHVAGAEVLARRLRQTSPAVVPRLEDDTLVFDVRTLLEGDDLRVVEAFSHALEASDAG